MRLKAMNTKINQIYYTKSYLTNFSADHGNQEHIITCTTWTVSPEQVNDLSLQTL